MTKQKERPMWETNTSEYKMIHTWVRKNKKIPLKCEICKKEKRLYAANISGKYLKDITDYEYLCQKCHLTKDKINKGIPRDEKTKKKISETLKGNIPWNKNKKGYTVKPRSKEANKQISESLKKLYKNKNNHPQFGKKGKLCHNYGRKASDETKLKMRNARLGKPLSEETKRKLSEIKKLQFKNKKLKQLHI